MSVSERKRTYIKYLPICKLCYIKKNNNLDKLNRAYNPQYGGTMKKKLIKQTTGTRAQ